MGARRVSGIRSALQYSTQKAAAAALALEDTGGDQAEAILGPVYEVLQETLAVYDSDPTLTGCPAGREQEFDLIAEIGRYAVQLVRAAVLGADRRSRVNVAETWDLAQAAADRLPIVLANARTCAVRNVDQSAGSRRVSALWLAAGAGRITAALQEIRAAWGPAAEMPFPDPRIRRLERLVDQAQRLADELQAERDQTLRTWNGRRRDEVDQAGLVTMAITREFAEAGTAAYAAADLVPTGR